MGRQPDSGDEALERLERLVAGSAGDDREVASAAAEREHVRPETLARLLDIAAEMQRLHRRHELLTVLRDRMQELFDAEAARVVVRWRDDRLEALDGPDEPFSHTVVRRVLDTRQTLLVRDTAEDPHLREQESVRRLGLVSLLGAYLPIDERIEGVLQFEYRERPGPFTEEDRRVLEIFAQQAATALKNMLLVEQLDETAAGLRGAQARLVEAERVRVLGQMSQAVAHDFNNKLHSILGFSDLLLQAPTLPATLRRDVESIRQTALLGAGTVRRLQAFSGGSDTTEEARPLDVVRILREVLETCRPEIEGSGGISPRAVTFDAAPMPPVLGRLSEVRDVFLEIVLNAAQALRSQRPDGGGHLAVRARELEGTIVVEIEDDGPGIDPDLRARVFEPFFTTRSEGHGLGLSFCWGIVVRGLGGSIELLPGQRAGTLVRVMLPAAPAPPGEPGGSPARRARQRSARILVVDNEELVLEVMCRLVESIGHATVGADGGHSALELLEHERFDLILSDFRMPRMDGAEFAREVRRRAIDCPVILVTGGSPGSDESFAESEGIVAVLRKPMTRDGLAEAIEQHLGE